MLASRFSDHCPDVVERTSELLIRALLAVPIASLLWKGEMFLCSCEDLPMIWSPGTEGL